MATCKLVIVGGTPYGGATLLAEMIEAALGKSRVHVVPLSLFRSEPSEHGHMRFENINWDAMERSLKSLCAGQPCEMHELQPAPIILLVGYHALCRDSICSLASMRIFVECGQDISLIRMATLDTSRGLTWGDTTKRYLRDAKEDIEDYILPSKRRADIVLPYISGETVGSKLICEYIRELAEMNGEE